MKRLLSLALAASLLCACVPALSEGTTVSEAEISLTETAYQPLMLNDVSSDVKTMQTQLTLLGYYTGSLSGHYGQGTAAAIRAFQTDFQLPVTGDADAATLIALYAAQYRPVKYGSTGDDVKRIQKRLTVLGYYTGKISGSYLTATVDAVSAFQAKMGLAATGEADVNTLAVLFSDSAVSRIGAAVKVNETPAPAETPAPDEIILASDGEDGSVETAVPTVEATTVKFSKKLSYNSTGKAVKQLQQRLYDLGYYTGNISGNYLGNTRNAVKAFQKQNALEADGVVGETTWNMIFNTYDVVGPNDTPRPTPAPDPIPFHIVVDVTNQVVTVYGRDENGEYNTVIRQMICSTGTKKNPSDVGDWVLSGRKAKWCYFPTWGDYARYWTKINKSIAFHSVIYNSVDVMDLSVKSYKNLGNRASHGCVRLTVNDAKWVYDNVPEGVVVTITEKLPADPELRASVKIPSLNTKTMLPHATPQPTEEPVYISGALPPQPLTKLQRDDSSEAVYWLQKKLTELGYYHGKCSGTYLGGTQEAVKAFQNANGLRANGTADVDTLMLLYSAELATPVPISTPEPLPIPDPVSDATVIPEETAAPEEPTVSEETVQPEVNEPVWTATPVVELTPTETPAPAPVTIITEQKSM